ncbi:primosomal protein N' [Pseudonocardia kunmingensis]|uniref:Probable replication restart protein PriA n=1 Tax=Pseudonocardia kunmingensis TaxID=630975 RepID=A0A543D3Y9_9PSEU|nr:primosomal protein N' [Pseudonocardia kunmingensis]TQM04057.1 replication restart DNA helicase PriA [Pseudonocardia kunmingensis]
MARASRNRGEWRPAPELPVARVAVDVALAHLDRPFDYRVPEHLDAAAVAGVRLRVRFAGRLVDGFLLERVAESGHGGRLAWIEKVVSPEPVLTPEVAALCRAVADRCAGVLADVLRLAVPPRHARVEAEAVPDGGPEPPASVAPAAETGWRRYPRGAALLDALSGGRAAHAVWQALPGEDWPRRLAEAAAATVGAGRGALLVVPDQRDVDALHAACVDVLGTDAVVALTADLGPAERYRRWLAVRRGRVRVVVGTRSAAFAPVAPLGLIVVWDDGDDLHAEPRAPYPQVRDVLVLRAHAVGAALLVGGFARTAEAHLLVESGWAREVVADRDTVRAAMPRILAIDDSGAQFVRDPDARAARLPHVAFDAARTALDAGRPVLVQVPRSGYVPYLSCGSCREPARCRHCAGPLGFVGRAPEDGGAQLPQCRWCGRPDGAFRCAACGSRRLRAGVVGAGRTAEELGRAFPGTTVRASGGGSPVLATVAPRPDLVVATPGAEPRVPGGYGAALLLDGWALLSRPDLRVAEETLRRWLGAVALVVPHGDGGRVVVGADAALPVVQALVRWDPVGHAASELAGRAEVGFPPAVRMAAVDGGPTAVAEVVDGVLADLPEVEVLGPVEIEPDAASGPGEGDVRERALLRVPRPAGRALAAALHTAQAARTARKATDPVRVRLDPVELG